MHNKKSVFYILVVVRYDSDNEIEAAQRRFNSE